MISYNITDFNYFRFSIILSFEEDFILENIKLGKGIGKNIALKENIFLMFVSLVTHIPLIILGKPGNSKSLSVKLILKAMEKKHSEGTFLDLYPFILQNCLQISDSTTQEDVERIFMIGENKLKALKEKEPNTNIPISMILFDNLELGENSKYNPLKFLNSHLCLDDDKNEISFIGISNKSLDSDTINMTLVLSTQDFVKSLDDLKSVSISIAQSINEDINNKELFFSILPCVYFNYNTSLEIIKKAKLYKEYQLQESR